MLGEANFAEELGGVLSSRGELVVLDPAEYFSAEAFNGIDWVPTYAIEVAGTEVWAVELLRGSWDLGGLIPAMLETQRRDGRVRSAVFIAGEKDAEWDKVIASCGENGIEVIGYLGGKYTFIGSRGSALPEVFVDAPCRIPAALIAELQGLELRDGVARSLGSFAQLHYDLQQSGTLTDEREQDLLQDTARQLIASDERFVGALPLLELLWAVEQVTSSGRDHFFHAFQDFFLGLIVIGRCRRYFEESSRLCFPGGEEVVPEYVWFLAALFHDLGYSVSQRHEVIYGLDDVGDPVTAELEQIWETAEYEYQRDQLVSLLEHLRNDDVRESWVPTAFGLEGPSAFGLALRKGFLRRGGHSVASAMRLLTEFRKEAREMEPGMHGFLARHVYLAALSMIFHDWRVRDEIVEAGLVRLKSSRFPYATLLMFIDSIQDDRREKGSPARRMDVLERLEAEDRLVRAVVNLESIGADADRGEVEEYLAGKRVECKGVLEFIEADGLVFEYPPEFLG